MMRCELDLTVAGQRPVVGCREYDKEKSGFINGQEYLH
jgi:hypothetical protein